MNDNMLRIEIARGVRIALPPNPRHISTYVFVEQEDWFEDEAQFVSRAAEPGGRMLDIGSSFGFYSLTYARAAGPAARIWAFEPTPMVCSCLRESIRMNNFANFTLTETAVGATEGRSKFKIAGSSELNRVDAEGGGIEVRVAPLDALDAEHGFGKVDFVKIDVEGHEAAVLEGGTAFFTRESPLVLLEVRAGDDLDFSVATRFEALGYGLYRIAPQLGALVPFDRTVLDSRLLNVFACKPDRAARLAERGLLCMAIPASAPIASLQEVRAALAAIPAFRGIGTHLDTLFAGMKADDPSLRLLRFELASRNTALPLPERCAALAQAATIARSLIAGQPSLLRSLTATRVLRGWGERGAAADEIMRLLPLILSGTTCEIEMPFLPPLPSYDTWCGTADLGGWVTASVVEAAALWPWFSSFWGEPTSTPTSEFLLRFGRQTPLLERRRQLRRILTGLQATQQPHPLLRTKSPENLNPGFWCGADR